MRKKFVFAAFCVLLLTGTALSDSLVVGTDFLNGGNLGMGGPGHVGDVKAIFLTGGYFNLLSFHVDSANGGTTLISSTGATINLTTGQDVVLNPADWNGLVFAEFRLRWPNCDRGFIDGCSANLSVSNVQFSLTDTPNPVQVSPEPASLSLLFTGLCGGISGLKLRRRIS